MSVQALLGTIIEFVQKGEEFSDETQTLQLTCSVILNTLKEIKNEEMYIKKNIDKFKHFI